MKKIVLAGLATAVFIPSGNVLAQETAGVTEMTYIFNTLLFLFCGALVMFMAAGFAMLEAGMVRSSSVASILTKNIVLYAIAGIMFYLVGYNLMYSGVDGGYFGTPGIWRATESIKLANGNYETAYAPASDWFFQMVFVATAASIVSGAVAERAKMIPFFIMVIVLTGFIYPIIGAWQWGGGWLKEMGFSDFAGSTLVHTVGGWAALSGAIIIGPRLGRFKDGKPHPMPASNLPLVTLGTFILWLGWFGFNGGSQLALGSGGDADAVAMIFVNTNMAAAAGCVVSFIATELLYKKADLTLVLNGALAGLVSITAEPLTPNLMEAMLIGAVGSLLAVLIVPLLERRGIDDVVGAIPVHLVCGIWGTLIVPFTNSETSYVTQAIGVASVGVFVLATSTVTWLVLKGTLGLRLDVEEELLGADLAELGVDAYPDFVRTMRSGRML